jgi:benzoyl-CoA reductase/2-hydroxyglutaryl-CoA dehydratase subunit BcrC/BadD/HgdB
VATPALAGLETLRAAYEKAHSTPAEFRVPGKPLVGVIGAAPAELIAAAGAHAVRLATPADRPTPDADHYMDDIVPKDAHAFFQAAHDGLFSAFDLLVLSRDHDKLYYYLKEVLRIGRGAAFPPLHMFDLMESRRPSVETYNRGQFASLKRRLERLGGGEITEAGLEAAMAEAEAVCGLRRRLLAHRRERRLSGVDALHAIGAGMAMAPGAYLAPLGQLVDGLDRGAETRPGPGLLALSAEPLDHPALHATLEAAGALVVAEDDAWGSRCAEATGTEAETASEAVFLSAWRAAVGPGVSPAEDRLGWAKGMARDPAVDAVVFYLPPSDHRFGWDYPALKRAVDEAGKPSLLLRCDVQAAAKEAAETVRRFLGGLRKAA